MSLRTPSKTGAVRDCCVEGRRRVITVQKPHAVGLLSVCLTVKPVGEPDALIGHVRFDERGWETERCRMAQATAPILDSTEPAPLERPRRWPGSAQLDQPSSHRLPGATRKSLTTAKLTANAI